MVALNPGYHAHLRAAADALGGVAAEAEDRRLGALSLSKGASFAFLILVADPAHPPVPCSGLPGG